MKISALPEFRSSERDTVLHSERYWEQAKQRRAMRHRAGGCFDGCVSRQDVTELVTSKSRCLGLGGRGAGGPGEATPSPAPALHLQA